MKNIVQSFVLEKRRTASSCMEDGCPGCPGASTEISQSLDHKKLPWLAVLTTHP